MARKRPPQHRADTPGIFIPRNDSSFDRDRHDKEIARMKEEGLDIHQHPLERYYRGKTRYDLDASDLLFGVETSPRTYFNLESPEMWSLRRLDWAQYHKVMSLISSGDIDQGQLLAARFGVSGVENSTLKLKGAEAGLLSNEDMQAIFDADVGLLSSLGYAVWMYSQPLSSAEKKV